MRRNVLPAVVLNTAFPLMVAVAFCASELCDDDDDMSIGDGVT